jgi:hypothetical protein
MLTFIESEVILKRLFNLERWAKALVIIHINCSTLKGGAIENQSLPGL